MQTFTWFIRATDAGRGAGQSNASHRKNPGIVFERWQATHRIVDADQVPVAGRCLRLPVPWVVLVVAGIWPVLSLPALSKANRRRSGYAQMHGNVLDVDPSGCHDDIADVRDIDLTAAQGAADTLRLLANQVDNVSPLLTQEARSHVVWLQALADSFNSFNFRHVGQAFRMMELANHVVFAGMLHGIGSETNVLHRILMLALKAGLPSRLATHLVDHLNINLQLVPSSATVKRHQLTLSFGWLLWQQRLHDDMLKYAAAVPGGLPGLTRHETMDSSPQANLDLLMRATITIQNSDIVEAFRSSCELSRKELNEEESVKAAKRLSQLVEKRQGCITATSSGASGLKHKCHLLFVQSGWEHLRGLQRPPL